MNEQEIREAIDACRPNFDDLPLPDMSALRDLLPRDPHWQEVYDRTKRCDALIGEAFRDVPVPAGLYERLLAATTHPASASPDPATPDACPAAASDAPLAAHDQPTVHTVVRRAWLVRVAALTATAAALLVGVFLCLPRQRPPQLNDEFAKEVRGWTDAVLAGPWDQDLSADELHRYPLDQVIRAAPQRWRQLKTAYDRTTLVYDLTPPGREFAFAFCLRAQDESALPTLPPPAPFSTTGGVAIGAWQRKGLIYVLTVQGGHQRYQSFLNSGLLIGLGRSDAVPSCRTRKV